MVRGKAVLDGGEEAGSGRLRIAIAGAGVSGLSAAWLLAKRHDVTVYEREPRLGGHSNTVDAPAPDGTIAVDTGFIVYNPLNYPNLTALFTHLGVDTAPSDMSFAVSLDGGALEYGGSSLASLFAQRRNLLKWRFWSMLRDLKRFYDTAPAAVRQPGAEGMKLAQFLDSQGYGEPFIHDHLLPMAGAIWSSSPQTLAHYPAAAFVRFFENHGLLRLSDRPPWRTVAGGSRTYVSKLAQDLSGSVRLGAPVTRIARTGGRVHVTAAGETQAFDRILIATHANEALALLADASPQEHELLSAFTYTRNDAILHSDARLMPKRRAVWSSWNYTGTRAGGHRDVCVTYWMNRLQPLATRQQLFVTLNPLEPPHERAIVSTHVYEHPVFTVAALAAQQRLASIQGARNTWFCGAYFGSGFHEDGLRSGLEAAEAMGGVRRPWGDRAAASSTAALTRGAAA